MHEWGQLAMAASTLILALVTFWMVVESRRSRIQAIEMTRLPKLSIDVNDMSGADILLQFNFREHHAYEVCIKAERADGEQGPIKWKEPSMRMVEVQPQVGLISRGRQFDITSLFQDMRTGENREALITVSYRSELGSLYEQQYRIDVHKGEDGKFSCPRGLQPTSAQYPWERPLFRWLRKH